MRFCNCPICGYVQPGTFEEGHICPRCGYEEGYDDRKTYKWDGRFWSKYIRRGRSL